MNRDQFGEFECVYWGLKGEPAPMRQVIELTAGILFVNLTTWKLTYCGYFNL